MANEKNYIEGSVNLSVEIYRDDDGFAAYLADDIGGSGIEVKGSTPKEVSENLVAYIEDYFYEND